MQKFTEIKRVPQVRLKLDPELIGAVAIALLVTAAFSGFNRPLWIDEYLHFALAGISWTDALAIMQATSPNINHGQTWFQQILSIGLLQGVGSSTIGLRVVSWLSSVALFLASFSFLRVFAVQFAFRVFFASSLVLIPSVSFEIGNSRFYIVLLAATALTVRGLYSTLKRDPGSKFNRTIFGTGVILGSVSHPYFPVILVSLFLVLFVVRLLMKLDLGLRYLKECFFYLGFAILGGILSIAVGSISWMGGSPDFSYMEPFEWLPFGFVTFVALTLAFIVGTICLSLWAFHHSRTNVPDVVLVTGVCLVILGLGLALLFSWISLLRNYWILPRQWLSGALLVLLGTTLLLNYLSQSISLSSTRSLKQYFFEVVVVVLASIFFSISAFLSVSEIRQNMDFWSGLAPAGLTSLVEEPTKFFSFAGNLNIKCGGKVWSNHSQFYAAGVEPEDLVEGFTDAYRACETK